MGSISACIQSNEVLENMDTMAEDDKGASNCGKNGW